MLPAFSGEVLALDAVRMIEQDEVLVDAAAQRSWPEARARLARAAAVSPPPLPPPPAFIAPVSCAKPALPGGLQPIENSAVHLSMAVTAFACDITRARVELGYEPQVTLLEGMRRSIRWCREEGIEL